LHKDFYRLYQKYGPIYTLYFGSNKGVVLNTPELWFEALNLKQDQTCNRPVLKSFMQFTFAQGVAMNNGPRWRAVRTILQTSVTNKQLGEAAEPLIMEELNASLYSLARNCEKGKSVTDDLRLFLRLDSLNVAMRKIFGFRFSNSMTPAYHECQDWLRIIFEHIGQGSPSDFMPILEYFPDKARTEFRKTCKTMHVFLEDELARHKREMGKRKPQDYDFMDAMLVAQKEALEVQKRDPNQIVISDLDIKVTAFDSMAGAIVGLDIGT
jgi:cytochrome P450